MQRRNISACADGCLNPLTADSGCQHVTCCFWHSAAALQRIWQHRGSAEATADFWVGINSPDVHLTSSWQTATVWTLEDFDFLYPVLRDITGEDYSPLLSGLPPPLRISTTPVSPSGPQPCGPSLWIWVEAERCGCRRQMWSLWDGRPSFPSLVPFMPCCGLGHRRRAELPYVSFCLSDLLR